MIQLFNDDELNRQLSTEGFVVFDCLSEESVSRLYDLYRKIKPFFWSKPVYCNVFFNHPKRNSKINDSIINEVNGSDLINIGDFEIIGGCFIVKKAGKENEVGLHQDWTITEEEQDESYILWVPLQETTMQNGTMVMLPCSHFSNIGTIRSFSVRSLYIPLEEATGQSEILELKAGQAVLYSSALFHGSFKNASKKDRVAVTAAIMPRNAEGIYYHLEESENRVYKLRRPKNFHLNYQPRFGKLDLLNELEILKVLDQVPEIVSKEDVLSQK